MKKTRILQNYEWIHNSTATHSTALGLNIITIIMSNVDSSPASSTALICIIIVFFFCFRSFVAVVGLYMCGWVKSKLQ